MAELPEHPPENPWRTLTSEEVYESPWIKVTKHAVIHPAGTPGTYSVVHFKHLAIGVLPLDQDDSTWLVGQYRYPLESYSWEIPAGGGRLDEKPLAAAQRELAEETGMRAARWTPVLEMHLSNSVTDERALIYVAQELSFGTARPEDSEQLKIWKVPFETVYELVVAGRITDSMTVAAVLRAKLLRLEGRL